MRASRFGEISRSASAGFATPPSTTLIVLGSNRTISVCESILSWIAWLLNATFSKMPCTALGCALWQFVHTCGMVGLAAAAGACAPATFAAAASVSAMVMLRMDLMAWFSLRCAKRFRSQPCGLHDMAHLAGSHHHPSQREAADEHQQRRQDGVRDPVAELEPLQRQRGENAERDDHAPECPGVRAAHDQRRRGGVRCRGCVEIDEEKPDQRELD